MWEMLPNLWLFQEKPKIMDFSSEISQFLNIGSSFKNLKAWYGQYFAGQTNQTVRQM